MVTATLARLPWRCQQSFGNRSNVTFCGADQTASVCTAFSLREKLVCHCFNHHAPSLLNTLRLPPWFDEVMGGCTVISAVEATSLDRLFDRFQNDRML